MPTIRVLDLVAVRRDVDVSAQCPGCGRDLTDDDDCLFEWQLTDIRRPARLARPCDPDDLDGNEGHGTVLNYESGYDSGSGDNVYYGPVSVWCRCGYELAHGTVDGDAE